MRFEEFFRCLCIKLHATFKNFVQKGYYDIDWCNFEDKYIL